LAHSTPRRELAPFLKTEAVEHLGVNAKAFGEKFDAQVRALAQKGARRDLGQVQNVVDQGEKVPARTKHAIKWFEVLIEALRIHA
jgi:hypothetical protein